MHASENRSQHKSQNYKITSKPISLKQRQHIYYIQYDIQYAKFTHTFGHSQFFFLVDQLQIPTNLYAFWYETLCNISLYDEIELT